MVDCGEEDSCSLATKKAEDLERVISQEEADEVYKRLKSEAEFQANHNM